MAAISDDRGIVYESWVLHHQASRSYASDSGIKKWTRFWMSLHGNTLSFCSSSNGKPGDVVGTLSLTSHAELTEVPTDSGQPGFGFQLKTLAKDENFKVNILMFEKQKDCDTWMPLITGVTKQLHQVQPNSWHSEVQHVRKPVSSADYVTYSNSGDPAADVPQWSATLGQPQSSQQSHQRHNSWNPEASNPPALTVTSSSVGNLNNHSVVEPQLSAREKELANKIALRKPGHKFYNNEELNYNLPAWFVECTKEKAETILGVSRLYGNVLLRPCSSEPNTRYAISFRTNHEYGSAVNHYDVIGNVTGFRINITQMHRVCTCLSDVMQYFVTNCGYPVRPLSRVTLSLSSDSTDTDYNVKHFQTVTRMQSDNVQHSSPADRDSAVFPASSHYDYIQVNSASMYAFNSIPPRQELQKPPSYSSVTEPWNSQTLTLYQPLPTSLIPNSSSRASPPSPSLPPPPHLSAGLPGAAPPPPPPPPLPPPPPVLTPGKFLPPKGSGKPATNKKDVTAESLQSDLQRELQLKLSKYRKGTYKSPAQLDLGLG